MRKPKKTSLTEFDYKLPNNLISQKPIKPRDHARLLILDKKTGSITHKIFYNIIDYFNPGDVLVLNNSKVIPARLIGKKDTGGKIEIFLLNKYNAKYWQVLIGGKIEPGKKIFLQSNIIAEIIKKHDSQSWLVKFNGSDKKILSIGEVPLPPYIKSQSKLEDYQTVYAKNSGSVAAPTAGLHFTKKLIQQIEKKGIKIEYITLHVGMGTFMPVKTDYIEDHQIHSEFAIINKKTANTINDAKKSGNKIIAVGTTSTRTLEAFTNKRGLLQSNSDWIDIFIYPGYQFKIVDMLVTNFHLPKSTLLMLISALAGQKNIKNAYQKAITKKYKFFSFGDAMLIK